MFLFQSLVVCLFCMIALRTKTTVSSAISLASWQFPRSSAGFAAYERVRFGQHATATIAAWCFNDRIRAPGVPVPNIGSPHPTLLSSDPATPASGSERGLFLCSTTHGTTPSQHQQPHHIGRGERQGWPSPVAAQATAASGNHAPGGGNFRPRFADNSPPCLAGFRPPSRSSCSAASAVNLVLRH